MNSARHEGSQIQPVLRRLSAFRHLSECGTAALDKAIRERVLRAGTGQDLICEGDIPDRVRFILSGWLARYKTLEDGRRQIVNFVLPGDACDTMIYLLSEMDHSIGTLTPVVYSELERPQFEQLMASDKTLAEALWCESLAGNAIRREWAVNMGRRVALERVAHLLCEIIERLRPVGLVDGNSCAFPITQMDLADATGLSAVHLNRTLQELRAAGLIVLRERVLTVNDLDALKTAALFNPNYLHYVH
ncbi:MAG: Crp/Fnr family transcriptional regulator [Bradyrhizobium sp.]|uniref:Crp/Fnr family transcriptional regulator n=1 Tax=Bradyrhizobium sp. TaxID=376 RepID=UPI0025C2F8CD|nr:Crp/Fnr family transcriptional regulator [Bradyrhizobium sp.]MBI5260798.1 Crp/Fnr family transcriptional regulator [Bradyrhizobium sp.]